MLLRGGEPGTRINSRGAALLIFFMPGGKALARQLFHSGAGCLAKYHSPWGPLVALLWLPEQNELVCVG